MKEGTCPTNQTFRVWPIAGVSFTIDAQCIHMHMPNGDWSLNREGGQIVALMQKCGTVIVNETIMNKDKC